jgi:O-antigen/teichoic acid export membrane protein
MKELTGYGWHLYTGGVLAHLNVYGTRSIIVFFLAPAQIAFFGLAQGMSELLNRVPQALGTILFPRISRSEDAVSVGLAANAFRITMILLVLGGTVLAIGAPYLLTILYGAAYAPAATPLRIILPAAILAGAGSTLAGYFQGSGRPSLIPRIAIGPLIVQVPGAILLTGWWGLNGAASALALGLGSVGLLQAVVFLRITRVGVRQLLPGRPDLVQLRMLFVHGVSSVRRQRDANEPQARVAGETSLGEEVPYEMTSGRTPTIIL